MSYSIVSAFYRIRLCSINKLHLAAAKYNPSFYIDIMNQFHGLRGKMGNFKILPASDWPTGFLSRLKESQLAHFSSGVLCSFLSTHLALCPMEVNKEEAIRCLSIAKNHFG